MENETNPFGDSWQPISPTDDEEEIDNKSCGGNFTLSRSELLEITSPGYESGNYYQGDTNCVWYLNSQDGSVIDIQIYEMEVNPTSVKVHKCKCSLKLQVRFLVALPIF